MKTVYKRTFLDLRDMIVHELGKLTEEDIPEDLPLMIQYRTGDPDHEPFVRVEFGIKEAVTHG